MRAFLFPALRDHHLVLWPARMVSASASQLAIGDIDAEEDLLRRRLVVVELRQEGIQDAIHGLGLVVLGEIGAVAPVLAGAEKEHLHAGLPAIRIQRDDIGLFDGSGLMP